MNATRTGKIARLPKHLRDRIGADLEGGVPGKQIVAWLNRLPLVQRAITNEFDGHPITEQNLSEWKAGGHQDWLKNQQAVKLARQLTEQAGDIDDAATGLALSDRLASVLSVQLARVAMALVEQETDPEKRWQRLCHVNRELARLRREDHRALHLELERERMETGRRERDEKKFQQSRARSSDSFLKVLARLDPRKPRPEEDEEEPEPRPRPPVERDDPYSRPDPSPRRRAAKPKSVRPPKKTAPSGPIRPNPTQSDLSNTPDTPLPTVASPGVQDEMAERGPVLAGSPHSDAAAVRLVDDTLPPARPICEPIRHD
jgi:hypothetical protein